VALGRCSSSCSVMSRISRLRRVETVSFGMES
jgi:hypothetical protein